MKLSDPMKLIRDSLNEEKKCLEKAPQSAWTEGRISGLQTALYFLDEEQEVKERKERLAKAEGQPWTTSTNN